MTVICSQLYYSRWMYTETLLTTANPRITEYTLRSVLQTPRNAQPRLWTQLVQLLCTASRCTLSLRRPPSALPHYPNVLILHRLWTSETGAGAHTHRLFALSYPWHCSWLHHCHLLPLPSSEGQPQASDAAGTAQGDEALLDTSQHHPQLPSICSVQSGCESSAETPDPALRRRRWGPTELPAELPQHRAATLLFQEPQLS